jgi:hypothetical protein
VFSTCSAWVGQSRSCCRRRHSRRGRVVVNIRHCEIMSFLLLCGGDFWEQRDNGTFGIFWFLMLFLSFFQNHLQTDSDRHKRRWVKRQIGRPS